MATPIEMPKPGVTVEECLIARWIRRKGDAVAAGEVVAEIETDKATFEVPAPVGGVILEAFFNEGELVPAYTNICVIGELGESVEAYRPSVGRAHRPAADPQAGLVVEAQEAGQGAGRGPGGPPYSPRARRFAEEHGIAERPARGSGPGGRILERNLAEPRLTPLARELAREGYEVPPEGSGLGGMVRARDLGEPAAALSGVRERIACRMRESLASSAQYTLTSSADASGLLRLRAKVKAASGLPDISIGDMVMFCAVRALTLMPELNAELIEGRIHRRRAVHLGFACDTPKGLLVPVIRDCHALTLPELSLRGKALAEQAVSGAISPDDLSGATFTVSNLGSFGIESFTPILNPPQVAVLGVNAIQLKPVRRNGGVEFIDHIGLSLTLDHQVIDGAPGARFLQVLRQQIETVESFAGLEL